VRLLATHPHLRLTAESEKQLAGAAAGLRSVARERVCEEIRVLLGGPGVERAVLLAARIGILEALLPGWKGFERARAVARLSDELGGLQRSGGSISRGAHDVAVAALAAPAAGFPNSWDQAAATAALAAVGWPPRAAQRAAAAAGLGEQLLRVLGRDAAAERDLAAQADDLLEPAAAWAVARSGVTGADTRVAGTALLRWWRRFSSRSPLLSGEEIAGLLGLPVGPSRGAAVRALRRAHARGEIRNREQAERFLRETPIR
jgi:hypothetical protein